MTTIAIITLGNRDLKLAGPLPAEWQGQPFRALTQSWRDNLADYKDRLELPILKPVFDYWRNQPALPDYIYLIATDQLPPHDQDTCHAADIIKRLLAERFELGSKRIFIKTLDNNPADYDCALDFYRTALPDIQRRAGPIERAYLLLSGGTPQMTAMLLIAGVETFGAAAVPFYQSVAHRQPCELHIARTLCTSALCQTLRANLDAFAYQAAADLLERQRDVPPPSKAGLVSLLGELLRHAAARLNFDFAAARQHLAAVTRDIPAAYRHPILALGDELHQIESHPPRLLAELYHGAAIKFQTGAYADFLGRLFRFQESLLRYLVERQGVRFRGGGEDLDRDYLTAQPALLKHLENYQTPAGGKLDLTRSVNRVILAAIAEYFAKQDPTGAIRCTLDQLSRLERLAELRNKTPIAHGFDGVSLPLLAKRFGAEAGEILTAMSDAYTGAVGQPIGPHPFRAINDLCMQLLESLREPN